VALYSAWDWGRNAWRVYKTNLPVSIGDDPKSESRPRHILGGDPDRDTAKLPRDAKFIGYSHLARGEVRRMPDGEGLGAADDKGFWAKPIVLIGLGAVAATVYWKFFRRRLS
jgi:hypothetical protein